MAVYTFGAREPNEISFDLGDTVFVMAKHNDDWWEGMNQQGEQGFFPANHVMLLPAEEPPAPPPAAPAEDTAGLDSGNTAFYFYILF